MKVGGESIGEWCGGHRPMACIGPVAVLPHEFFVCQITSTLTKWWGGVWMVWNIVSKRGMVVMEREKVIGKKKGES